MKKQTNEVKTFLWQSRLPILILRQPAWVLETCWLPILLSIPLYFIANKELGIIINNCLFIIVALIVFVIVNQLNKHKSIVKYPYNLILLLYQLYDFTLLLEVAVIFFSYADNLLIKSRVIDIQFLSFLRIFLLVSIATNIFLAILFSPKQIKEKMELNKNKKTNNFILYIMSLFPGLGILVGILLSNVQNNDAGLLILSTVFYIGSFFFYILIGFASYELIYIIFRNWDYIYKNGNKFELSKIENIVDNN
jgi:hypothetical protein